MTAVHDGRLHIRNGEGKLKVIRGHHRLDYAKRLGIGVWYIIDSTCTDIFELEGESSARWSVTDFLHSRAKVSGDAGYDYREVIEYQKRYGIAVGAAISLMAGESAGSNNAIAKVKRGNFRVSKDLTHALLVGELVNFCRAAGANCAGQTGFVNALSAVARVPEFEPSVFRARVRKMPSLLVRQTTSKSYMELIEEVYNYGAKGKRIPLAFRAAEIGRQRKETFGGRQQSKRPPAPARRQSTKPTQASLHP